MGIFSRNHDTVHRLGGEGWDLTPGAADNLASGQIEIVGGRNWNVKPDAPSEPAEDGAAPEQEPASAGSCDDD